jgi:hypothetical protein
MLTRTLWGASLLLITAAVMNARELLEHPMVAPPVIWAVRTAGDSDMQRLDSAARVVASSDPFRLERAPSSVPYSAAQEGAPVAPPPPEPPKPKLALVGIVGGPPRTPWVALLDGVPGRDGSVLVHAGDTIAGLRVRNLGPRGITITGLDTTWKLTLERPWQ